MRYWISQAIPPFDRVLLVESGRRELVEELLPGLYDTYPAMRLDLCTCYAGLPASFNPERGRVYRVADHRGAPARKLFYKKLGDEKYNVLGMICSGEPIMTKWKWALASQVQAKVLVYNENGDWFWADRSNWRTIRHFVLYRAGMSGAGAVRTIVRLLLFPFTLIYLLLYAAAVHLRRKLRTI